MEGKIHEADADNKPKSRRKVITDEEAQRKRALFDELVKPFYPMIYKLTKQYTNDYADVKDNYYSVLTILYLGVETYNPSRPIRTWIHICTKRHCYKLNRDREKYKQTRSHDISVEQFLDESEQKLYTPEYSPTDAVDINNYTEMYNDDITYVIDHMNPLYKEAFLLQVFGYSLKEIAEILHERGSLESSNIDTVKSRLFLARQCLKKHLTRDGTRRINQSDKDNS